MSRQVKLHEFISGTSEVCRLTRKLWPEQSEIILKWPASDAIKFLSEKTGVFIDGKKPLSFQYWLPALRKMASE